MTGATLETAAQARDGRMLIEKAERLVPLLREQAKAIEDGRRLTPVVRQAFIDAGFYRLTMPAPQSGVEGTLPEDMRVLETLAKGDASAAWSVWAGLGIPAMSAFMDAEGAEEVFGSPDANLSGSEAGMGRAIAVEGGYRVSGHWRFLSNIHQARHVGAMCFAFDGEAQRQTPDGGPVVVVPVFPVEDCRIIETWDTTGLRGTGSDDIEVEDLFVPAHRVVDFSRPPREGLGPINYLHVETAANITVASIAVGVAEAAMEAFDEIAQTKKSYNGKPLIESPLVPLTLGVATTRLAEARGHLFETAEVMWEHVADGSYNPEAWFAPTALASVAAVDAAIEVTASLYRAAGSAAIRSGVLDRCLRDLYTLGAHKTVQHANLLKYGAASLQAAR